MPTKRKSITVKRGTLKKGDRLMEFDHHRALLVREQGEWWCECKEWEWDCDIGPNGDVWCVQKCVRYECVPGPTNIGPARE
jgi:hypothetical protein